MVPRYWASFWLRGMGGLPGLHETLGSPVLIEDVPSSAFLASLGGPVADYPPEAPPWPSEAQVVIRDRGRAWFASYGVAAWLSVLLVGAAVRARRWRVRIPLAALGLSGSCWLSLPFLPTSIGLAALDLVGGAAGTGFSISLTEGLILLRTTRLGVGVGLGLIPVLVAAWLLLLTPLGLAIAGASTLRARTANRAAEERREEEDAPLDPIPVLGREDLAERGEPTDRPDADPESVEPHPSPHDGP